MANNERKAKHDIAPAPEHAALTDDMLRWRCDPSTLPFSSTSEVEPLLGVIGQDTAVEALRFGLEIQAPGQNIFVRGLAGTGRMTLVRRLLEEMQPVCQLVRDRCYVHNFAHPERPRLITLPRGQGRLFKRYVGELADFIRDDLEIALSSEGALARQMAVRQASQKRVSQVVDPFEAALKEAGLALVSVEVGPVAQAALFPLVDGKAVPPEEWDQRCLAGDVSEADAKAMAEKQEQFEQELGTVMQEVNQLRRREAEAERALQERAARTILSELTEPIAHTFDEKSVRVFLDELIDDVAGRRVHEGEEEEETRIYRVNLLSHKSDEVICPIVIQNTPTMSNLLGQVDPRIEGGEVDLSDHLTLRAGCLLRADGGYLILDVKDVLQEPGAWKVLVRTLRTGMLEIVPPEMEHPGRGTFLKPEPIDVQVKVILLGNEEIYYQLDEYDDDFPLLFKVLADFDNVIVRNKKTTTQYVGVLARIIREEGLPTFDSSAVAALMEYGARVASRKDRLTTRFGRLADIAREGAFITQKAGREEVSGDDVRSAIHRAKQRANLPSKRFQEMLADGTIRVATRGRAVGQVNGLAVIQAGPLIYGFPNRITATIGPGTAGVINIEREADLSGAIHTKGFYILSGLLRYILRTEHPLAFHASVAFEQSYGGIDGDSASTAEICCLLSSLTDVPLRQDLAITGAIDQVGNVLAIGAANEKIEGFFDTCRASGLTGTQGVIIPNSNARDLMLREDVAEACQKGQFAIYAVGHVGEALQLLTGHAAGVRGADGEYPKDSVFGVAVARAYDYWLQGSPNTRDAGKAESAG